MPNPLFTALGASVGSVALMGLATMTVASTSLAIVSRISKQQRMKLAVTCDCCSGSGNLRCEICMGKGILRARAPRSMKQLLREASGQAVAPSVDCVCPACGSTMQQRCLNCLGEGKCCLP